MNSSVLVDPLKVSFESLIGGVLLAINALLTACLGSFVVSSSNDASCRVVVDGVVVVVVFLVPEADSEVSLRSLWIIIKQDRIN